MHTILFVLTTAFTVDGERILLMSGAYIHPQRVFAGLWYNGGNQLTIVLDIERCYPVNIMRVL